MDISPFAARVCSLVVFSSILFFDNTELAERILFTISDNALVIFFIFADIRPISSLDSFIPLKSTLIFPSAISSIILLKSTNGFASLFPKINAITAATIAITISKNIDIFVTHLIPAKASVSSALITTISLLSIIS